MTPNYEPATMVDDTEPATMVDDTDRKAAFRNLADWFEELADIHEANPHDAHSVGWNQFTWGTLRASNAYGCGALKEEPSCGTHACIAGWVVLLDKPNHFHWSHRQLVSASDSPSEYAQRKLGLTDTEARVLFDEMWWPYGLAEGYEADDPDALRKLASELRYFATHRVRDKNGFEA